MSLKNTKHDPWIILGVYFGYPKCCIKSFMKMEHLTNTELNPFCGTGFLCCEQCKHRNIEEVINDINSKRYCNVPFEINGFYDQCIENSPEQCAELYFNNHMDNELLDEIENYCSG